MACGWQRSVARYDELIIYKISDIQGILRTTAEKCELIHGAPCKLRIYYAGGWYKVTFTDSLNFLPAFLPIGAGQEAILEFAVVAIAPARTAMNLLWFSQCSILHPVINEGFPESSIRHDEFQINEWIWGHIVCHGFISGQGIEPVIFSRSVCLNVQFACAGRFLSLRTPIIAVAT